MRQEVHPYLVFDEDEWLTSDHLYDPSRLVTKEQVLWTLPPDSAHPTEHKTTCEQSEALDRTQDKEIIPTANSSSDDWSAVYRLAYTDDNTLYAATNGGLMVSSDAGATWNDAPGVSTGIYSSDVKVGSNGTVIACINNKYYRKKSNETDFENRSDIGGFPKSGINRLEFAFAPSDPNYVYCAVISTGNILKDFYQSTDNGENWTVIGPGGGQATDFYPFSYQGTIGQGDYDCTVGVSPANPEKVFVGGISFWTWENGKGWKRIGSLNQGPTNQYYVHADNHTIVFHPTKDNIMYIGNDGGVYKTTTALADQPTFIPMNKGYNVTQFYSMAAASDGHAVFGGTQDNGTNLIDSTGNTGQASTEISGGDGGFSDWSSINPEALFAANPYGEVKRSSNLGDAFSDFYDENIKDEDTEFDANFAPFVTAFRLWESYNDTLNPDSILWQADTSYGQGDIVKVQNTNNYKFDYVIPQNINEGDTLMVQDVVSAKFVVGKNSEVWLTKESLVFSKIPTWYRIASSLSGSVRSFAFNKDGDVLYVGTISGNLYKISNIGVADYAYDNSGFFFPALVGVKSKNIKSWSNQAITSIDVDDKDPDKLIVTLGNYSNNDYVYISFNATDNSPTFTSIQSNLPEMPVYSGAIFDDPTESGSGFTWIVLGTEYGVYATNLITQGSNPTWFEENDGLARVATFMIRRYNFSPLPYQSWGGIRLYAATHGRGLYKTSNFLTGIEDKLTDQPSKKTIGKVNIFPNPVINGKATFSYAMSENEDAILSIYDIQGKMVYQANLGKKLKGPNQETFNAASLHKGIYLVHIKTSSGLLTIGKFIKAN
ncbi:MAG: T9SS type A sorting domain-containing protein [Bacteroidia bacterium]|nr:T9SS type A sorting domain-containing protein [Bacteroidia bacterium]